MSKTNAYILRLQGLLSSMAIRLYPYSRIKSSITNFLRHIPKLEISKFRADFII